jgi:hypothetical protein
MPFSLQKYGLLLQMPPPPLLLPPPDPVPLW